MTQAPTERLSITLNPGAASLKIKGEHIGLGELALDRLRRDLTLDVVAEVDVEGVAEITKINGADVVVGEDEVRIKNRPTSESAISSIIEPAALLAFTASVEESQGSLAPAGPSSSHGFHFGGFNRGGFAGLHIIAALIAAGEVSYGSKPTSPKATLTIDAAVRFAIDAGFLYVDQLDETSRELRRKRTAKLTKAATEKAAETAGDAEAKAGDGDEHD